MGTRIIICSNCGTLNKNNDYCEFCNTLISDRKKREIKADEVKQKQIKEVIQELENPNLAERLKKHPNILYKITGWLLYSVITVVSAIGAGLAWFIAMVAAG
ncbi:hypothetical protein [Polaribacter porphyrae]|uniref:Uncharacterized protein n=1 Tax=Polaribacter porphyrae TaxID=1137780 RepID=A0A2S7WM31_9FLAO|nr:hypothetical protein [Polaribacter porphyrae]PQJ78633.1 hypothetical protein BTO18_05275 [Polaribacter porphyrae]